MVRRLAGACSILSRVIRSCRNEDRAATGLPAGPIAAIPRQSRRNQASGKTADRHLGRERPVAGGAPARLRRLAARRM